MKKLFAAGIVSSLLFATPGLSATRLKLNAPWQGKTTIDIAVTDDNAARLVIENGKVMVIHDGGEEQLIIDNITEKDLLFGQWGLHFDDFNMDGRQDFALDVSYGYGGVNVFSNIYIFNAKTGRFEHRLGDVSNIDMRAKSRELYTAQKSGPLYYSTIYRIDDGRLFKFKDSTILLNGLEKATVFDRAGTVVRELIFDDTDEKMVPAIRKIIPEKAWLYSAPNEKNRTRAYLIKGDEVSVLDVSGEWFDWYKIRYEGKKPLVRWVQGKDIIADE